MWGQAPSGKGQNFPTDARRFVDAATEFAVLRLTSPTYSSYLTAYYNRAMSGRNSLLFSNDRTGRLEVFRADLKNGQTRQLTSAAKLDPASLALLPGDRAFCYFDGHSLRQMTLGTARDHEVYRVPDGVERGAGFSVASDGTHAFLVEREGGRHRLRMISLLHGTASTVVESEEELRDPIPRPGHSSVLYRQGEGCWLVGFDGSGNKRLPLAEGGTLAQRWSADGRTLLYLNVPRERGLNTLREFVPEAGADKLIAKTSQFVGFGVNGDASVFVGASGSLASPHVLILLRSARRELTMCEHRASHPLTVAPVFAPNSQRILFQSDLHGKPAIYTMSVDRFVEETES